MSSKTLRLKMMTMIVELMKCKECSYYFCRGVLPKDLIVEELVKYDHILKHDWVLQDNIWNIH